MEKSKHTIDHAVDSELTRLGLSLGHNIHLLIGRRVYDAKLMRYTPKNGESTLTFAYNFHGADRTLIVSSSLIEKTGDEDYQIMRPTTGRFNVGGKN